MNSHRTPNVTCRPTILLALTSLLLTSCNPDAMTRRIVSPARDARARRYLGMFTTGQHDSIMAHARFGSDAAAVATGLAQIDSLLRGERLDSMQLVGASLWSNGRTERLDVSFEFRTRQGWNVASVVTVDSGATWFLDGIHVNRVPGELKALNGFRNGRRTAAQYLVLLLVIASAAFSLGTAGFIATRRAFPKRWRWVFAALVGVGSLKMNWTTGEMATTLLNVQLLGASALKAGAYAPWILAFSFPIGPIVALGRYRQWLARRNQPASADTAGPTTEPDAAT
jgi:hypothetical protein